MAIFVNKNQGHAWLAVPQNGLFTGLSKNIGVLFPCRDQRSILYFSTACIAQEFFLKKTYLGYIPGDLT
jgi:hypothetical protein